MAFFNATPEDFKEVIAHMDDLGGPTTFNHYPIGWAQWTAGSMRRMSKKEKAALKPPSH
jgi:hypothetical protein